MLVHVWPSPQRDDRFRAGGRQLTSRQQAFAGQPLQRRLPLGRDRVLEIVKNERVASGFPLHRRTSGRQRDVRQTAANHRQS